MSSKNSSQSLVKIILITVGIITVIIIGLLGLVGFAGFKFINWFDSKTDDKLELRQVVKAIDCEDNYKIDFVQEKGKAGFPQMPYNMYFLSFGKNNDSKELTNINRDIEKYNKEGQSEENKLPLIRQLAEKLDYKIVNPTISLPQMEIADLLEYTEKSEKIKTIYISPDKFSKKEYEILSECYLKNQNQIATFKQEKSQVAKAENATIYFDIDVLAYGKPNDIFVDVAEKNRDKYANDVVAALECNQDFFASVDKNGLAYTSQFLEDNSKNNNQTTIPKYIIGHFNDQNDFEIRQGKIDLTSPVELKENSTANPSDFLMVRYNDSDEKTIIEKEVAQKLYDEKGPKTEIIQTCKTENGKTLQNLFK